MIYELLIGVGVLVYLLWKYLLTEKKEGNKLECKEAILDKVPVDLAKSLGGELKIPLTKDTEKKKELQQSEKPNKVETNETCIRNDFKTTEYNLKEPLLKTLEDKNIDIIVQLPKKTEPNEHQELSKHVVNIRNDAFEDSIKSIEVNKSTHNNVVDQEFPPTSKNDEIITPSILLKQQQEKTSEKIGKRESPQKERFAEFLEKTILSDDKIQSIIHNLSLDKTESVYKDPITPRAIDIQQVVTENGNTISKRASKLQESIDQIADRVKRLNDINVSKECKEHIDQEIQDHREPEPKQIDSQIDKKPEENPILKRFQKQPGFPPGLNFGSVIGELKNKTRNANGGLKPVFKKFERDAMDNAQACFFRNLFKHLQNHGHRKCMRNIRHCLNIFFVFFLSLFTSCLSPLLK